MNHAASIQPDTDAGQPARRPADVRVRVCVALLLAAFAAQAFFSMRIKSATWDEPFYLAAGTAYLTAGEWDLNPEHPPLAKLLSAASMQLVGASRFRDVPGWETATRAPAPYAAAYLFNNEVDAERLLFWARLPTLLVALALGWVVWRFARDLYGERGGLLALGLFAFSPNLLAHGRLATLDLCLAAALTGALYAGWRFLQRPSVPRALLTGVLAAAALLVKHVAVVILPLLLVCLAWRVARALRAGDRAAARALVVGALVALGAAFALVSVAFGPGHFGVAEYVRGFKLGVLSRERLMTSGYETYLFGRFSADGFWWYFPAAFLVKTPLPTLALLATAAVLALRRPRLPSLAGVLLVVPVAILFLALAPVTHGIGLRYLLPAYPLLFILAGGAAAQLCARRVGAYAVAVLGAWYVLGTLRAHPDYLPYFHELAGGPAHGARYLDGSNVDWGQDVGRLAEHVRAEGIGPVKIMLHPGYLLDLGVPYYGREDGGAWARPLPWQTEVRNPQPGWYAVSLHLLMGREIVPGSGIRFDWRERYEPAGHVGHSILLYRF